MIRGPGEEEEEEEEEAGQVLRERYVLFFSLSPSLPLSPCATQEMGRTGEKGMRGERERE